MYTSKKTFFIRIALMACGFTLCSGFTFFNPSDNGFLVRMQAQEQEVASVMVEPRSHLSITLSQAYPSLTATYQTNEVLAAPNLFESLSSLFSGKKPASFIQETYTTTLTPSSYEGPAINNNFYLMIAKGKPVLFGPQVAKGLAVRSVTFRNLLSKSSAQ